MSANELGNNDRFHQEMSEIKELLRQLVQSQSRQEVSLDKLAEAQAQQANIQNNMLQVLRSNSAGNEQQEETVVRANCSEEPVVRPNCSEETVVRANYNSDRNLLLLEGDCRETIEFLRNNPEALKEGVTPQSHTVLHMAIFTKREMILIEEIVELMSATSPRVLAYKAGEHDFTALHVAAHIGDTEAAKVLVDKDPNLLVQLDNRRLTPLDVALRSVSIDQKEVSEYLYSVTKEKHQSRFLGEDGADTLCGFIEANFYDMALRFVMEFPETATKKSIAFGMCGLEMIVRRPFAFKSGVKRNWWQNFIYSLIQVDMNSTRIQPVQATAETQVDVNSTCIQLVEATEGTIRDEENPLPQNLLSRNTAEIQVEAIAEVQVEAIAEVQVEAIEGTIGDEENPQPQNLLIRSRVDECLKVFSSTTLKGIINPYLTLILPYLTRAICIQRLYNQKLVHQQAIALIKQILSKICEGNTYALVRFLRNNPNIMKLAIKHGIIEFVAECVEKEKYLIFYEISGERTMIQIAITERKEMAVNFICETSVKVGMEIDLVSRTDGDKNTILHYTAKLAPFAQLNFVSGAVLQMQREMQWFKGIESILRESDRFTRNKDGDTAQFIFTEAHKDLVKEGQDWLKDTSGSCMIVGALITTISFTAAFTVPGGNFSDSNSTMKGTPIFLGSSSFSVFAMSDAVALFSSITSVLMFLAIYTSRYAEMDFLKSLPQKLIFGLATLFISMVATLIAFGASLFIVVGSRFVLAWIPIALLSCCPMGFFAWLQLPLFVEMVRSTYWGGLFKKHKYTDLSYMERKKKED